MIDTDLIPYGSSHYYAIRFSPQSQHNDLARIISLYRLIRAVPQDCSDPIVAKQKLDWWHQELQKATDGNGDHPATKGLDGHQDQLPAFQTLLQGVATEASLTPLPTQESFLHHCNQTGAVLTRLLTEANNTTALEIACAEAIGIYLRTVEIIRHLGRDLRRGRCLLPHDLLQGHNLTPPELMKPERQDDLSQMLGKLAKNAVIALQHALKQLNNDPHPALASSLSMAVTSHLLLGQLHRDHYPVISHQTSLTPLRKLWASWRTQRKVKRGRRVTLEWVE